MKKKADTTYTFRLPADLLEAVKDYAEKHDESVSAVIRKAVRRYIAKP